MEYFLVVGMPVLALLLVVTGIILLVLRRKEAYRGKPSMMVWGVIALVLGVLGLIASAVVWYVGLALLDLATGWVRDNAGALQ